MGDINSFAIQPAEVAAARLWAFGSAPYPFSGGALIQRHIEQEVTNIAIAFAIHVRRILDNKAVRTKFELDEPFRIWSPASGLTKGNVLRDASNRIIHATEFRVGFEKLPDKASRILGGAIGVIYLSTRTDQRDEALIDVFALASCFFYKVLPNCMCLSVRPYLGRFIDVCVDQQPSSFGRAGSDSYPRFGLV